MYNLNLKAMNNTISILKYSERAIVVTGDTKPIKAILKGAGGKFNSRLTNPITKAPLVGWIFSKSRETDIMGLLSGNGIHYDRVTPSNFNESNIADYIPCPSENVPDFCPSDNN
jgi:hypothetical protein